MDGQGLILGGVTVGKKNDSRNILIFKINRVQP